MRYTRITLDEMDRFLRDRGFSQIDVDGVSEKVYGKRVDKNGKPLSLRVYTSIDDSGVARDKGNDAIRVELFEWRGEPVHIGHSKRVNRISTWRKNLGQRLASWEKMIGPNCPKCGASMVLRNGKYGTFWGCSNYKITNCKQTKKYHDK